MIKQIREIYNKFPSWLKNRYALSAIIFTIWIFFFDTNSVVVQIEQKKEINKINADLDYYQSEIQKDQKIIDIITTDSLTPSLEKYLREELFLSKKNEKIFIIK